MWRGIISVAYHSYEFEISLRDCSNFPDAGVSLWAGAKGMDSRPHARRTARYSRHLDECNTDALRASAELRNKEFFTSDEAAEYEKQARERNHGDRRDNNPEADLTTGYNDFWWDRGTKVVSTRRTSVITNPPDG